MEETALIDEYLDCFVPPHDLHRPAAPGHGEGHRAFETGKEIKDRPRLPSPSHPELIKSLQKIANIAIVFHLP